MGFGWILALGACSCADKSIGNLSSRPAENPPIQVNATPASLSSSVFTHDSGINAAGSDNKGASVSPSLEFDANLLALMGALRSDSANLESISTVVLESLHFCSNSPGLLDSSARWIVGLTLPSPIVQNSQLRMHTSTDGKTLYSTLTLNLRDVADSAMFQDEGSTHTLDIQLGYEETRPGIASVIVLAQRTFQKTGALYDRVASVGEVDVGAGWRWTNGKATTQKLKLHVEGSLEHAEWATKLTPPQEVNASVTVPPALEQIELLLRALRRGY